MRRITLIFAFCLIVCVGGMPVTNASVPAVAASVGKAILKYFGKQGAEEATEYLSKRGGKEIVERVVATATRQGGDEAVEQVAKFTGKYGPDALAALDNYLYCSYKHGL